MVQLGINYHKRDSISLAVVFILITIPDILSYYAGIGQAPQWLLQLSMCSVFLLSRYMTRKRLAGLQLYLLFCFFVMLVLSLFHLEAEVPKLTLFSILLIMLFGVLCKEIELTIFNNALFICFLIWSPILLYQILKTNLDIGIILNRGYTWTEIFAYGPVTVIWVPFLFSSVLLQRRVAVSMVFWGMALFMGLISLKRDIIVESILAFLMILYVAIKLQDKKLMARSVIVIVLMLVGAVYFVLNGALSTESMAVYDALSERFSSTAEDINSFDRLYESRMYFAKESGFFDFIFGKGFISAHHAFPEIHFFLHIGWLNFIFKGGIILLLGILYGYRSVFKVFFSPRRYPTHIVFAAMCCIFYFFDLFFGNLMGFGPALFLFFYCLVQTNRYCNASPQNKLILYNNAELSR